MTATPLTRDSIARQNFTLSQAVQEELGRLQEQGQLGDGVHTQPRCYVCCEVESKSLVNKLLAAGLTNREIAESCGAINTRRRSVGDERLIDASHVYRHRRTHFKLDEPAHAVYRSIVERHAEQANIDHVNGVGTAVSPYAVLHTLMVKGFADVTTGASAVTVKDLISASSKLQEWINQDTSQQKMADIMVTVDRIIQAAHEMIPAERHEEFLARVEGREEPMAALTERMEQTVQEAVREFTPRTTSDDNDDLDL
jgi:hypothetical protein